MYIVGKLSLGNISIGILNKANNEKTNNPIMATITAIGRERAPAINSFILYSLDTYLLQQM